MAGCTMDSGSSPTAYVQGHGKAVLASHASRTAANSCGYFIHLLRPGQALLDVGCGPGTITASLVEMLLPGGRAVGIDASREVIEKARKQPNLAPNCTFEVGDVLHLPFENESFDVVHAHFVLTHLTAPVAAFTELRRVCKRGGFVACREAIWNTTVVFPEYHAITRWKAMYEQMSASGGMEPNAGRHLIQWALQVGFDGESVQFTGGSLTYAGKDGRWWGEHFAKRVAEDETWREKVLRAGLTTEEELQTVQEAWMKWAAEEAGVYSLLCGQIVCSKS